MSSASDPTARSQADSEGGFSIHQLSLMLELLPGIG